MIARITLIPTTVYGSGSLYFRTIRATEAVLPTVQTFPVSLLRLPMSTIIAKHVHAFLHSIV